MNTINKQLFEIPGQEFKDHLELISNERILFSGKFGKGKTTFIKHFFEYQSEYRLDQKYFTIYISPVNYSVASNEDIIRYIKFDIVLEFLKRGIEFEENDFDFMDTLPLFIRKHPEKIIGKLLYFIPFVGKELDKIYKKGKKLYGEIQKHNSDINAEADANQLEDYMETIETTEGSIYENDFITKIIEKAIDKLKIEEKKIVLIIDDLDRLDPDHIFRILNVFAAHFDKTNAEENKFGFDKVIVVCDYNNIRNIYKHRYGAAADFNGYIDKFYSNEPFNFLNNPQVSKIVDSYIDRIIFKWGGNQPHVRFGQFTKNMTNQNAIITLIKTMVIYDYISLRVLLNYTREKSFYVYSNIKYNGEDIDMSRGCIIFEGIIVNDILGGNYKVTNEFLFELEAKSPQIEYHVNCFNQLLLFLMYPRGNFHNDEQGKVFNLDEKLQFTFDIKRSNIENLKRDAGNGIQVSYQPTSRDYLKLCRIFFGNLYSSNISSVSFKLKDFQLII